jgi:hypothetical protein
MKTKDELLIKRVRCIGSSSGFHYPGSPFQNNDILTLQPKIGGYEYYAKGEDRSGIGAIDIVNFSHLFKQIEWWEDREEKDLPEYLKGVDGNIIWVDKWFFVGSDIRWHTEHPFVTQSASPYFPATEAEYNEYVKKH